MIVPKTLLFDALLAKEGILDKERLQEAKQTQKSERNYRSVGRILFEEGIVDRETVARLIERQRESLQHAAATSPPHETLFGAIAIMKKFVTLEQVQHCLSEQKRLRRLGLFLRLGEIMVSKGYMTLQQVLEVLRSQRTEILECRRCRKVYNVTIFAGARKPRCPLCGDILQKPRHLKTPRVNGRA
ncbi:MAG: hypothetical protein DRP63_00285 [Planctomycetota bacterium]|nr:MAG: hypothetical protein DRP63_00285 [Planctomycetota bacterium]